MRVGGVLGHARAPAMLLGSHLNREQMTRTDRVVWCLQLVQEAAAAMSQLDAVVKAPRGSTQQVAALGNVAGNALHGLMGAVEAVRKETVVG
jgi:hypothetical protein